MSQYRYTQSNIVANYMRTFNRTLFVHLFLTCGFVGLIMLLRRLDMSAYFKIQQTLDVIAQFNRDGSIIPLVMIVLLAFLTVMPIVYGKYLIIL